MSELECPECGEIFSVKDIYQDLQYTSNLLKEVIERIIEVNDFETMIAIEDLLIEKDEYVRVRDMTKELNQKIEDSEWLIEMDISESKKKTEGKKKKSQWVQAGFPMDDIKKLEKASRLIKESMKEGLPTKKLKQAKKKLDEQIKYIHSFD